jgi:hypothetical protein
VIGLRASAEYAGYLQRFSPGARYFLGAATLAGINAGVASVLLNLYIRSLGPEITLGQVLWAGPAGAIVAGLLSGPLVDRCWRGRWWPGWGRCCSCSCPP